MKGVVFQLLEDVAQREYGHEAWDQLLATAGGAPWSPSHPALLTAARADVAPTELDALSALRRTGRRAIPLLANLYPQLFVNAESTRSFLVILAGGVIIDPKRGLVRWAAADSDFRVLPGPDGDLFLGYRSNRHPCALAEGLIEGAADYYGEAVGLSQLKCRARGDNRCLFWISVGRV
jgi:Haem-NO-binding